MVLGFITQKKFIEVNENERFLFITPGIRIEKKIIMDQQYRTHKEAIVEDNNDIIIVGSCVHSNNNPIQVLSKLKSESYNYYNNK